MPPLNRQTVVDESTAGRVDKVVAKLTELSHRQVLGLIDHGCVKVNDAPCAQSFFRVNPGDVVKVVYEGERKYKEKTVVRTDPSFRMVFEDDHLVVVDKAAGFLTVPNDLSPDGTLKDRVAAFLSRSRKWKSVHIVHRLDREVSGVLVIARHSAVARDLVKQFTEHKPHRIYAAIVAGGLPRASGTFKSRLATALNLDRYSTRGPEGELAITHYKRIQTLKDATLVHIKLETGKRNQIRVHFAEAGHPVLGDPRYKPDLAAHPLWRARRIALHALELGFTHPVTGKKLMFQSQLPSPFMKFIQACAPR